MGIVLNQTEDSSLICLEGAIDISSAAELKATLLEALQRGRRVCVSVEDVAAFDVTAFQLLWAAGRQAVQLGVEFAVEGDLPEAVRQSLGGAGIDVLSIY